MRIRTKHNIMRPIFLPAGCLDFPDAEAWVIPSHNGLYGSIKFQSTFSAWLVCILLFCFSLKGVEKHSANSIYTVHAELLNNGGLPAAHAAYRSQGGFENQLRGSISNGNYVATYGFTPVVSLFSPAILIVGAPSGVLVASLNPKENGIGFEVYSSENHFYTVQYQDTTPDPNGTWTTLSANHEGNGNELYLEDVNASGLTKRFYRIVIDAYSSQYISDPFGFHDLEIEPGPNLLSLPLMGMPVYQGAVSAVGDGTVVVSENADWADDELAMQNGFHQYIVLLRTDKSGSPGNQGDWWGVFDNTGNTLTVEDRAEDLTVLLDQGPT